MEEELLSNRGDSVNNNDGPINQFDREFYEEQNDGLNSAEVS